MNSKLDFGQQPLDYHMLATEAVHEVRGIIASEPTSVRGLFWGVLWEAARVSNKQLICSFLSAAHAMQQVPYQPSVDDMMLAARLALAIHYRPDLLVDLPRHSAVVRPFRSKIDFPAEPESGSDSADEVARPPTQSSS